MLYSLVPRLTPLFHSVAFALAFAFALALASAIDVVPYTLPGLEYSAFGGSLGLFGSFSSVSLFDHLNASSALDATPISPGHHRLFFYDSLATLVLKVAEFNGHVKTMIPLSESTILINGNFTSVNNQAVSSPLLYDLENDSFEDIRSSHTKRQYQKDVKSLGAEKRDTLSLTGNVSCMFKDNDIIYLGGDILFNNTYGAVMYNYKLLSFSSTPFLGFGEGSRVNAISKISGPDDSGSILFGGSFDTLGIPQLLTRNITSHNASNNTSDPVFAEQAISLKSATFSSVNGDPSNDDSAVINPPALPLWQLEPNVGGEWLVLLPPEMRGVTPSKARIYVPPGLNGIKTFRIYSHPNGGIMNLTYIDPDTNQVAYCDAWCPLSTITTLRDATAKNAAKYNDSSSTTENTVILDDGSFVYYADATSRVEALRYSSQFQEFGFVNTLGFESLTLTTVAWYGDRGAFSGLELYTDTITVYANQALNQPNGNLEDDFQHLNTVQILGGTFTPISQIDSAIQNTDYLVAEGSDAKVKFYPNITYTGNYLLIIHTPGCLQDNSCLKRAIVNVAVLDANNTILSSHQIYQNNDYDKYDPLYSGPLVGTAEGRGLNRVEVTFDSPIGSSAASSWVVLDSVQASIINLDSSQFPSNSSKSKYTTLSLSLNGLFEYSLGNFSNFDVSKVYNTSNDQKTILPLNAFVGQSSINRLSSQFARQSVISDIVVQQSNPKTILLQGTFQSNSTDLTLRNANLLTLSVDDFNSLSNSTDVRLMRRQNVYKRDINVVAGATFNSSVSRVFAFKDSTIYVGKFALTNSGNSSIVLKDLSNSNKSTNQINNIALRSNNEWYGFGNQYIDEDFTSFVNVTINEREYFVFASDSIPSARVWDNSNSTWVLDSTWNIENAVSLGNGEQVLSGSAFTVFNRTLNDQAVLSDGNNISSYDIRTTDNGSFFTTTFWANQTFSAIGGHFTADGVSNVAFINSSDPTAPMGSLEGQYQWSPDAEILSLYVDSSSRYLYMGFRGSIRIGSTNVSGLAIYDLKNNSFTNFQPAALQTTNGRPVKINSMAFYDNRNQLLVGGDFDTAGSLTCDGMCIYDVANTRWISPVGANASPPSGEVTTIRFTTTLQVLLSGNLTIGSTASNFASYDLTAGQFESVSALQNSVVNSTIDCYIINDQNVNSNLQARLASYGSNFVSAFDGQNWHRIDDDIMFDNTTRFHDLKLLQLSLKNSLNNGTFFDSNKVLALAGEFTLQEYGRVNVALYNGTNWSPFLFTVNSSDTLGSVRSLLTQDLYKFQSSDDLNTQKKGLSDGRIVGISFACALGSTALLGLLYLIPFFLLFRDPSKVSEQRIQESDMMDAVSPLDLLHEIDLQRHT